LDVFAQVVSSARPFFKAACAHAGHTLGIFEACRQPVDAAGLASALGLASAHRLQALLDVLVLDGALQRQSGRYAVLGVPPRPDDVAAAGWGLLAQVILEDVPLPAPQTDAGHQAHLLSAGAAVADEVATRFLAGADTLLDLGGGSGAYTRAYTQAYPHARAALIDRAPVLALAAQNVGERAHLIDADILRDDLGGPYDAVLLSNVLHLYGPDDCKTLVARAAAALAPGGALLVKDFSAETETGRLFAVNMALYTERGTVHPDDDICGWMLSAGLHDNCTHVLATFGDSMVAIGHRQQ